MSPDEARVLFATARVARLATVGADGRPHLVPIVFTLDGDTLVTAVDAKPKRTAALKRLENIRAEPRVALLADHYDEDWAALWWVRADGRARVLDIAPAAIARLRDRYPQYTDAPPAGPVIEVAVERWTGWRAGP